jgi:hypothetical protein
MLYLHRSLLRGDSRLLQLDTINVQVIPTSIHPGSASTQFQRLIVRRQQYGPRQPYDQGQKKLLLPHFSISDLLAPHRCNTVFWASSYTNIFSVTCGIHKNVQQDARVQPRDRKYLPTLEEEYIIRMDGRSDGCTKVSALWTRVTP